MAYIGHLAKSFRIGLYPDTHWEKSDKEIKLQSAVDYICRLTRVQGDCIYLSKSEVEPFVQILKDKGFVRERSGDYRIYKEIEGLIAERFISESEEDDDGYVCFHLKVGRQDQFKFTI